MGRGARINKIYLFVDRRHNNSKQERCIDCGILLKRPGKRCSKCCGIYYDKLKTNDKNEKGGES